MPVQQNTPKKIQTFSSAEQPFQRSFGLARQRFSLPLLDVLHRIGVTPYALSLIGLSAMALLPLGFVVSPIWFVVAYSIHLFMDGIDGPLARHTNTECPRGQYVDYFADHGALILSLLAIQWYEIAHPFWLSLYGFSYLVLAVHLAALNARGHAPQLTVVRTKYPLFLLLILQGYSVVSAEWLQYFLIVFSFYNIAMIAYYFVAFQKSLSAK